ncbi:Hsp20/alpha crystallin family protein [Methanomethylovorans sp.]|uniref:Hsp20/alpha crystallin family protein n=1 Tax=Methanomethylovorans sp. TaxID=2758717 RepID=UPI00351C575D
MRQGLVRWTPLGMSKWDPFEEISRMQDRLGQLFSELSPSGEMKTLDTLSPMMDVQEKDKEIVVKADMPGVDKKDVEIDIKDNMLYINANTHRETEEEKEGYVMRERAFSRFARTFSLPANVMAEGAKAKLEDGVLTINIPKAEIEEKQKILIE